MGGSPRTVPCKANRLLLMIVLVLMSTSDEHQRRSPDCVFFTLSTMAETKGGSSKKGRASKASRISTQSNFTSISEGVSVADTDIQGDDSTMPIVEPTKTVKSEKGAKKDTKARKPAARSKRQASKAADENTQVASSFLEPEDDDFEVKVEKPFAQTKGINKRKSDRMSTADAVLNNAGAPDQEEEVVDQPRKRRTTRSRVSMAHKLDAPDPPAQEEYNGDAQGNDEDIPPPVPSQGRKKGKGGNKRGSSHVRKASVASAASKASLRAILPPDEEIDAELEAELDRPLTDEEGDIEPPVVTKPLGRRLTRTKPGSRKATASVAPTRRTTRASTVAAEDLTTQDIYASLKSTAEAHVQTPEKTEHAIIVPDSPDQPVLLEHQKEECLHKNSEQRDEHNMEIERSEDAIAATDVEMGEDRPMIEPQQERSRQVSRQDTRIPDIPRSSGATDLASDMNSSTLDTQAAEDDVCHDTDASVVKQASTKRGSKKAPAKRTKGGKKAAVMTRNVEVVAERTMDDSPPEEQHSHIDPVDNQLGSVESISVEVTETKKPRKPSRAIARVGKTKKTLLESETLTREASVAPLVDLLDQPNALAETGIARPSEHPPSTHSTPKPASSPQSSDAENRPPSSCLSKPDLPPSMQSPFKSQTSRVPLAVTTPIKSPSRNSISKLQTTFPWTAVEVEHIFGGTPIFDKENSLSTLGESGKGVKDLLTSPEKKLTVEQWIQFNAKRGEENLRNECERLVGSFEDQGVRALRVLEGIVCAERPR